MRLRRSNHLSTWLIILTCIAITGLIVTRIPVNPPADFLLARTNQPSKSQTASSPVLPVYFEDKTLEMGLNFIHQQGEEHLSGLDESLGSGACAFDYDNDGWTDLFLVNGSGHTRYYGKPYWWQSGQGNALFRNINGTRFENVTAAAGLSAQLWGMGCLTGDFDNDGDRDLLVTGRGVNNFYKNNGNGTFSDITKESGISSDFWSTSAAAADFNGDGLLDFYIGNFIDFKKGARTFEADSQFTPEKQAIFDSSLYEPQPNQLYLNLGGMKFRDIAAEAGVRDMEGRTLDVAWLDLNHDGKQDLIVSNDRGSGSNVAFLNQGNNQFVTGGAELGLRSALGSRGIASGDLNNDGESDLVIASAGGENTIALIQNKKMDTATGHYKYTDRAREMDIGISSFLNLSAWSPGVHDFNNDGFNDLFISSGLLEPDMDAPHIPVGQAKQLLLNRSDGQFVDVSASSGPALLDKQSARGTAFADFDNDGDIDIYVAHNNDLGQFLVNQSLQQHWLGLRLAGKNSNRDALGAIINLTTAKGLQSRTVTNGEGFLSDSDRRVVFGLGNEAEIQEIQVIWPNGAQQVFKNLTVDHYSEIEEGDPKPRELPVNASVTSVIPTLRLNLGADSPDLRVRYVKLIASIKDFPDLMTELLAASLDREPVVRRAVIRVVTDKKSPQGLNLLIKALEDKDAINVVAAVEGLCQYEDESSVRWLLRQFSHPNSSVKEAVAKCFAFFFQEEEAVVHRKYLALPYLIHLMDDTVSGVRRSAASALANAERYKGMNALITHLNDPDPMVRSEVVRTLGLIRQRYAIPELRRLIDDADQPAEVIANAFIALKRLNENAITATLNDFVMGKGSFLKQTSDKRLATLEALTSQDEDSTAFDLTWFKQLVNVAFIKSAAETKNLDSLSRWIKIRSRFFDDATKGWLDHLSKDTRAEIRLVAYRSLLTHFDKDRILIARHAWKDSDAQIRQLGLIELLRSKTQLSTADYQAIIGQPDNLITALPIWSEIGIPEHSELLIPLLSKHNPGDTKTAQNKTQVGLEQICQHQDSVVQSFCINVIFAKATPDHCALATKLLEDQTRPLTLRNEILERYNASFDPEAVNTLFILSKNKKDPLHSAAIHQLFGINASALTEFAHKTANDPLEDGAVRFDAIEYLIKQGKTETYESLFR